MKKLDIVKATVGCIASVGIGAVVENAIKSTTPAGIGKIGKLAVIIGSLVLGSMLSDMAGKYIENTIDEGVKLGNELSDLAKSEE